MAAIQEAVRTEVRAAVSRALPAASSSSSLSVSNASSGNHWYTRDQQNKIFIFLVMPNQTGRNWQFIKVNNELTKNTCVSYVNDKGTGMRPTVS